MMKMYAMLVRIVCNYININEILYNNIPDDTSR